MSEDINEKYAQRDRMLAQKLDVDADQLDREQMLDIIANFKRGLAQKNQLTVSELRHFEWLFSDDLKRKLVTKTLTEAEQERYMGLSAEFRQKVDLYTPIHVVDDITGKDVMPVLPPINRKLTRGSNEVERQLINSFNSAHQMDDGNPSGMIAAHQRHATQMVIDMVVANNLKDELHHEQDEYIEMSRAVMNAVHKDDPATAQAKQIQNEASLDPDDGFDFDL